MAIYISNALYLLADLANDKNRPVVLWESQISLSGYSADSTLPGFPASAMWSGDTYTRWRSYNSGTVAITVSVFLQKIGVGNVDCIGIAGHNLYKNGISYRLFSSVDGVIYSPLSDTKLPSTSRAIIEFFDATDNAFFRIDFVVPPQSEGVSVAHIKAGAALVLQRKGYVGITPCGMGKAVEKISSRSFSGQHLGSVLISQGDKFSISQENNTPEFIRSASVQGFFAHANLLEKKSAGCVETFFYAWRPLDFPNEVQYCGETKEFSAPHNQRSNGMMQWSMSGDAFE